MSFLEKKLCLQKPKKMGCKVKARCKEKMDNIRAPREKNKWGKAKTFFVYLGYKEKKCSISIKGDF